MSFKRVYEDERLENGLFVTVLVECQNCGNKERLNTNSQKPSSGGTVADEYIESNSDGFINSVDITDHTACDICGEEKWAENMEVLSLGYPSFFNPDAMTDYLTIDRMIERVETFRDRTQVAYENGFVLHTMDDSEQVCIFTKREQPTLDSDPVPSSV